MAEVDIICDSTEKLKEKIQMIQKKLVAIDTEGNNMQFEPFDVSRII